MRAITFSSYDIKRIFRHRFLWAVFYFFPIVITILRCLFPGSKPILTLAWAAPFVCAGIILIVMSIRHLLDQTSGLYDAFLTSKITESDILISRILTGTVIFASQMAIFSAILLLRF